MGWVKTLAESYQKPQTYGSELEAYIVSKNPQNTYDVEMLAREFENKQRSEGWAI
jgi:hypothetical protein